jgi:hypothetical protein
MRQDAANRRAAIMALALEGLDGKVIAERLGIAARTVRGHLAQPAMIAALRQAQDDRLRQLTRQALTQAERALRVLDAVAQDEAQPGSARVGAARAVLDLAAKLIENTDLVERIEALEAAQPARTEGRSRWAG